MVQLNFEGSVGTRSITLADDGAAGRSTIDRAMRHLADAQVVVATTIDAGDRQVVLSLQPEELRRISTLAPTQRQFEALRDALSQMNDQRPADQRLSSAQLNEGAASLMHRFGAVGGRLTHLQGTTLSLRIPLGGAAARADDSLLVGERGPRTIRTPAPHITGAAPERPTTSGAVAGARVPHREAPEATRVSPNASVALTELASFPGEALEIWDTRRPDVHATLGRSQLDRLGDCQTLIGELQRGASDPAAAQRLLTTLRDILRGAGMGEPSHELARSLLAGDVATMGSADRPTDSAPSSSAPQPNAEANLPPAMQAMVAELRSQLANLEQNRSHIPAPQFEAVMEAGRGLLATVTGTGDPARLGSQMTALRDALQNLQARLSGVTALAAQSQLQRGISTLDGLINDRSAQLREFPQSFGQILLDILLEIVTLGFASTRLANGTADRTRFRQAGERIAQNGGEDARLHTQPPVSREQALWWLQQQLESANPWMAEQPRHARQAAEVMYDAMRAEYARTSRDAGGTATAANTGSATTSASATAPSASSTTSPTASTPGTTAGPSATATATATTAPTATNGTDATSRTSPAASGESRPMPLSAEQRTQLQQAQAALSMLEPSSAQGPLGDAIRAALDANPATLGHAQRLSAAMAAITGPLIAMGQVNAARSQLDTAIRAAGR